MINNNNKLRFEDIDPKLYTKDDINGYSIYFLDKEFTKPFTGEIYVNFKDKIEAEAEYKNGYKDGLEYIYYSNGEIEQINECRGNLTFGVSKEFDENGNLTTVSIVWNNDYLKIIHLNNNKIEKIDNYKPIMNQLPEKIAYLFSLSDEELINYKFK